MSTKRVNELHDQIVTMQRKYEKLERSQRLQILELLKDSCYLIPLKSARAGLYIEDIERILKDEL